MKRWSADTSVQSMETNRISLRDKPLSQHFILEKDSMALMDDILETESPSLSFVAETVTDTSLLSYNHLRIHLLQHQIK